MIQATHALRMAASEEWLSGQPTRVVLADGETDQLRLKKGTRTLLAPSQGTDASSMILPMHEVSAAGYQVQWQDISVLTEVSGRTGNGGGAR